MIDEFLKLHGIEARRRDHPPVYTCEEAERLVPQLPGRRTKNLFLRDRKGRRHFLVIIRPEQMIDLKDLASRIGCSRLSMASPRRLKEKLGVEPGSVSFLSLLHDTAREVEVVFDSQIWHADALLSHPMVNTSTLVLSLESVRRILELTGHSHQALDWT